MQKSKLKPDLNSKIKSAIQLKQIIARLKNRGKTIVFTNGCFDLLHYGHVQYLENAKRLGDILVVALNSNASVRRIKGPKRPFVDQTDRARVVAALESVDYVVIFKEDTPLKTIRLLKPDVLVKGADWKKGSIVGSDVVLNYAGTVRTIKLTKGRSTTNLIKKIARVF